MFSVYSKNKGIGLTVPILLEGSVYIRIYIALACQDNLAKSCSLFSVGSSPLPQILGIVLGDMKLACSFSTIPGRFGHIVFVMILMPVEVCNSSAIESAENR